MKYSLNGYIYLKILMIALLAVLFTSCDLSSDDKCGKTFTESELNDSIATANNFNIILKNGCKVVITGTYTNGGNADYFLINTGSSEFVQVDVTWSVSGTNVLDFDFVDNINTSLGNTNGTGSLGLGGLNSGNLEPEEFSAFGSYSLIYIQITDGVAGGTVNYTITVSGVRLGL